jgi:hypothetical protein
MATSRCKSIATYIQAQELAGKPAPDTFLMAADEWNIIENVKPKFRISSGIDH